MSINLAALNEKSLSRKKESSHNRFRIIYRINLISRMYNRTILYRLRVFSHKLLYNVCKKIGDNQTSLSLPKNVLISLYKENQQAEEALTS